MPASAMVKASLISWTRCDISAGSWASSGGGMAMWKFGGILAGLVGFVGVSVAIGS